LELQTQPEIGEEGYDAGAAMLYSFFRRELSSFLEPDLDPLGKAIIECCLDSGTLAELETFIPQQITA
jgi:hypothetical protein